jgi:chromosome segregation ATPase
VAGPTNTEKIDGLIKSTFALEENLLSLRRDFDQVKRESEKFKDIIHELDKQLTRVERDLQHAEKEVEKLRLSRYEFGKLLFAAFLGGGISFGLNQLNEMLKTTKAEPKAQMTRP